jgi:hypothetical protein
MVKPRGVTCAGQRHNKDCSSVVLLISCMAWNNFHLTLLLLLLLLLYLIIVSTKENILGIVHVCNPVFL